MFLLAGCSACRKKDEAAIEVDDKGSVAVNPTAAADAEFLDAELTAMLHLDLGITEVYVYKGIAQVSDDNSMAAGKFFPRL